MEAPLAGSLLDRSVAFARRRRVLVGAVVLAALVLAFLGTPLARYADGGLYTPADISQEFALLRVAGDHQPGNNLLSDLAVQMHPWVLFNRDELGAGRVPLWNPYNGGGIPHLANYQSAVFSPFSVPFYVLPFGAALLVAAFAKLFLLAFFTFLFLDTLRLSFWPAILGGSAFAFCGHNVFLLGFPHAAAAVTLPAGLYFVERVVQGARGVGPKDPRASSVERSGRTPRAALVGLAATLSLGLLGGQPEPYYFALLVIAGYVCARLCAAWLASARDRGATLSTARVGLAIALTAALAAGLAAFQLLPFFEYLAQSRLIEQRAGDQTPLVLDLWPLAWFPDLLGNPSTRYHVHGSMPPPNFETANSHYVGGFALLLALLSLAFVRRRLVHVFFVVVAVLWYLYAHDVAGLAELVAAVPTLDHAPINRSQIVWTFAIAVAAAFGLEGALAGRMRGRASALWIATIAVGTGYLFVKGAGRLVELAHTFLGRLPGAEGFDRAVLLRAGPEHVHSMLPSFGAGVLVLLALVLVRRERVRSALAACAALVVFVQSGWLYRDYNPVSEERFVFPRTTAIDALTRAVGDEPVLILGRDGPPPASNLPYRLRTISSYDGMWVARYDRLYRDLLGNDENWRPTRRLSRRAMQLFGVQHLLARGGWLPSDTLFGFADYDIGALYESAAITPESEVVQHFTATENDLQAVGIRIGTHFGRRGGRLALSLEDPLDGHVIASDEVDCDAFDPTHRLSLHVFDFAPIQDSRDRTYRLRIACTDREPGRVPTVWVRRDYRKWQNRALWRATRSRTTEGVAALDEGDHPDLAKWRLEQGGIPLEGGLWFDLSSSLGDYEELARIDCMKLYASRRSRGRFHTVGRASIVPSSERAWACIRHPAFDPMRAVVLEEIDPAFVARHQGDVGDGVGSDVTLLDEVPGSIRLQVERDTKGWLVLGQSWYPGWKARVGGVEVPVVRANYAFVAVPVEAGSSVVELDYEPASFRNGLWIAGACLVLGLVLCFVPGRRGRARLNSGAARNGR